MTDQFYAAMEGLRLRVETATQDYRGKRRPTWSPALVLEGELLDVCLQLKWLEPSDKPVARLWANFTDPSPHSAFRVLGFTLTTGMNRAKGFSDGKLFYSHRNREEQWSRGPKWVAPQPTREPRPPDEGDRPSWCDDAAWARIIDDANKRYLFAMQGHAVMMKRYHEVDLPRFKLRERAAELGFQRVMDFAEATDVQMVEGARVSGTCCMCGRGLTDALSVERGIGPECWGKRAAA